jgi:cyclopropane fatty-acyl-phospholipid synthase-like methyltransferase
MKVPINRARGSSDLFSQLADTALGQIAKALASHFVLEDWHSFGADYAPTVRPWLAKFNATSRALAQRDGERVRRMSLF